VCAALRRSASSFDSGSTRSLELLKLLKGELARQNQPQADERSALAHSSRRGHQKERKKLVLCHAKAEAGCGRCSCSFHAEEAPSV